MDISPSIDKELFQTALRFVDLTNGLEDDFEALQAQLEKRALAQPEIASSVSKILDYIRLLAYPSHLSVQLLIEHDCLDRANETAVSLMSSKERQESFALLAKFYLAHHQYVDALHAIEELDKEGRYMHLSHWVDKFLHENALDDLILLAGAQPDTSDRMVIYKFAAIHLARQGLEEEALSMLDRLKGEDEYGALQSNLAAILSKRGYQKAAEKITLAIEDQFEREDAIHSVLTSLLHTHQESHAMAFTEKLKLVDEKIKAAKLMERVFLAHHDEGQVKALRSRFQLPQTVYKRAA